MKSALIRKDILHVLCYRTSTSQELLKVSKNLVPCEGCNCLLSDPICALKPLIVSTIRGGHDSASVAP